MSNDKWWHEQSISPKKEFWALDEARQALEKLAIRHKKEMEQALANLKETQEKYSAVFAEATTNKGDKQ